MRRPFAMAATLFLVVLAWGGRAGALNPDRNIHQLAHRSWGEKDGYTGRAEALAQTRDGFLWVGTDDGLFRFDGVHFERYKLKSGEPLPSGPVRGLRALPDGSLWIAYRLENKICVLREGSLQKYGEADGVASHPTTIVQDHEGTIWANTESGVIRFDGRRWERVGKGWNFPEDVPDITSEVLFVDSKGTLWAGVNHTILYLEKGSKRFETTGAFAGWSSSIAEAPDGTIWLSDILSYVRPISKSVSARSASIARCEVATPKGVSQRCPSEDPQVVKLKGSAHLLFDHGGSLWMATDTSGVVRAPHLGRLADQRASNSENDLQVFTSKDGLSADSCTPILEDREGNIWVGTRDGLDQFRDTALVPVDLPTSLYRIAIAPADNGDLWIVGSWAFAGKTHGDSRNMSFVPASAFKVYRDRSGRNWFLSASLEQWKDGEFRKLIQSPEGRASQGPGSWQVAGDGSGTLWAFSNGHGFFSLDHNRWKAWATPPDVANQHVANMYSDTAGRIWVSTYEGDIITMDKGAIVEHPVTPEIPLTYVKAFAERTPQEIWAGGAGGLVLIDKGQFRVLKPSLMDSLADVTGIVDAGSDGLWLNAADGIIHISKDEIDRTLRDSSHRFQWRRFDSSDGLPGRTEGIYPYPKAVQGTDGRIWFSGTKGVAWLDPKNTPTNSIPPPVYITSIFANGSDHRQLGNLRFPPHTANLQINYNALSLSVPERISFRYKLDGIDKEWQDVSARRQAFYSNLGPGSYRFRVIACNNDGVWNETGDTLEFAILPAYYQTTWFRLLCGAAMLFLLWGLYQFRLRQIGHQFDAKLAERARIVQELRTIIDSIPGFVCAMSAKGEIELLNRRLLEYFGKTFEEMKAGWATNDSIHPEDRARSFELYKHSVETGTPHEYEQRYRRADGVYRWFHRSACPVRDTEGHITGWYALMTDIEDRKRAEDELQRKEAFLAEGQHISSTGTFSWRLDTDEVALSKEGYRIFDLDPDALVTLEQIGKRVHPDDRSILSEKIIQALAAREIQDYDVRLRMEDDSVKYLQVSSHPTHRQDGGVEYIGAIQDVTQRRLAEESVNELRSELTHMARVASLGVLTASITHEVSQPLSGIMTNASTSLRMLGADPPNLEGAMETTRRTIRDGKRASEVIVRLRELFHKKDPKIERIDLNEAAREVLMLCSDEFQKNGVNVRQEFTDGLPHLAGDRVQLQQVILNLLRNASDAMIRVANGPKELAIRTETDGPDSVCLKVRDTGEGIREQDAKALFKAFYTTKPDGMGIGLAVSQSIIERHGGRIWATKNDGPGATFAFSIPFNAVDGTDGPVSE